LVELQKHIAFIIITKILTNSLWLYYNLTSAISSYLFLQLTQAVQYKLGLPFKRSLNNTFTVYYSSFYMLWPEINPVQQDFHFQTCLWNWRSTLQKYVLSTVKLIASYFLLHNIKLHAQNTHMHKHKPIRLNSIVSVV
jgi:hypothetical protein